MKLSDYPVPEGNNAFGWHWLPQLADARPEAETKAQLQRMRVGGAKWLKVLTSPGGDIGWERGCGRLGACELTLTLALDMGFGVVVRLYDDCHPPYLTPAVEANLKHLLELADGRPFYVEPANEIDAEWAGPIHDADARRIVSGIVDFVDWCWEYSDGQIIPVWPSFGYGGTGGRNWFQLVHDLGRGDVLDECAVAVHNYPKGDKLYAPWDTDYLAGTPISAEEFYAYPWRWDGRTLNWVNAKRAADARQRARLTTDEELMAAYASGWFTYKWALRELDQLGHTETPLLLTETGLRVGEMSDGEPRIDPQLHLERSLELIADARAQPRILGITLWEYSGKAFAPIDYVWEDACCISPMWDRRWNATMPEGEYRQIETPGQLPLIDALERNPIAEGRG
jgi:hypothetical protein